MKQIEKENNLETTEVETTITKTIQSTNPLAYAGGTAGKVKHIRLSFFSQFAGFIKEYGVIALAIGIVIGSAVNDYVKSIVDNVITPTINYIISINLDTFKWGNVQIGLFLKDTLKFLIVLFIIFFTVKYVLKFFKLVEDKDAGKK